MKITFNVNFKINKEEILRAAKMVLFKSMLKIHQLATEKAPVDVGTLRNTIILDPLTPGFTEYKVATGVDYAIHVEFGTRPHHVSAGHLKGWARRNLKNESAAYAVANAIAKRGTEAQPFMRPALHEVQDIWIRRFWDQEFR